MILMFPELFCNGIVVKNDSDSTTSQSLDMILCHLDSDYGNCKDYKVQLTRHLENCCTCHKTKISIPTRNKLAYPQVLSATGVNIISYFSKTQQSNPFSIASAA